jgi:MYXO-CTERM domain-containing protein
VADPSLDKPAAVPDDRWRSLMALALFATGGVAWGPPVEGDPPTRHELAAGLMLAVLGLRRLRRRPAA